MRITETQLRRIIRSVIRENSGETIREGEGDFSSMLRSTFSSAKDFLTGKASSDKALRDLFTEISSPFSRMNVRATTKTGNMGETVHTWSGPRISLQMTVFPSKPDNINSNKVEIRLLPESLQNSLTFSTLFKASPSDVLEWYRTMGLKSFLEQMRN